MIIYRIVGEAEWSAFRAAGVFEGSAHDRRDGFIHFSTAAQAEETADKHYAGRVDLVLLSVDAGMLADRLKWEPSRGGRHFPHLYGPLPLAAVSRGERLPLGADGRFAFPPLDPA